MEKENKKIKISLFDVIIIIVFLLTVFALMYKNGFFKNFLQKNEKNVYIIYFKTTDLSENEYAEFSQIGSKIYNIDKMQELGTLLTQQHDEKNTDENGNTKKYDFIGSFKASLYKNDYGYFTEITDSNIFSPGSTINIKIGNTVQSSTIISIVEDKE